jgi:hypothetical protein
MALVLAITIAFTSSVSAHETLRWWLPRLLTSEPVTGACVSRVNVTLQELGSSGIKRLRAKLERRAPYDSGLIGLSYQSSGWIYSTYFPDDFRSYYVTFGRYFRYPAGGRYQARAVLVGERPGFWRPDRKVSANLGEIGCDWQPGGL